MQYLGIDGWTTYKDKAEARKRKSSVRMSWLKKEIQHIPNDIDMNNPDLVTNARKERFVVL